MRAGCPAVTRTAAGAKSGEGAETAVVQSAVAGGQVGGGAGDGRVGGGCDRGRGGGGASSRMAAGSAGAEGRSAA